MAIFRSVMPRAFEESAIDPESSRLTQLAEAAAAAFPAINEQEPAILRANIEAGKPPFQQPVIHADAEKRTIPGVAGPVGIRILRCPEPRAVYLHIHGGGWTIGGAHHQDPILAALATAVQATVVSVDYRLAPEFPYPAGPDDCEAAAIWVIKNAKHDLGSDLLLIGGESAGAHLAAVTLLRLRDRHGFAGFKAANLVYGAYDLTFTPSVRRWGARKLILSTPIIEWFTSNFQPPENRADPDVSPLYADLRGLPPALFTVGTLDPLLDDSLFMHARWSAAGNDAELALVPGAIHAFDRFPHKAASEAHDLVHEFLRAAVDRATRGGG
jgi:acetyl esterase/lipase